MINKNQIQIIKKLNKEFTSLQKPQNKLLKIIFPTILLPIQTIWEDGTYCNYNYNCENFLNKINTITYKQIKPTLDIYNKKITRFIKKCDKWALKFGYKPHDFWRLVMMINFGKNFK